MSNVPLGTIAALLRHSSTDLVKRYAHLSPSHLQQDVEMVSVVGKEQKPEPKGPLQSGTVTGTGTEAKEEAKQDA